MVAGRFAVDEPRQQVKAALSQGRVGEHATRSDHRLGENGVRVGQSGLGPRPRRVTVRSGHRSGIVGDQHTGPAVLRVEGE